MKPSEIRLRRKLRLQALDILASKDPDIVGWLIAGKTVKEKVMQCKAIAWAMERLKKQE